MTSLSPATTGEEKPAGAGAFHLAFLPAPNSTGGFWLSATPDPPAPRKPGRVSGRSPRRPAAANIPRASDAINPFMALPSVVVDTVRRREVGRSPGFVNPLYTDLLNPASAGRSRLVCHQRVNSGFALRSGQVPAAP